MIARRTLIGLCALCALFVSAIGAASAGAVSATAYTCAANTATGGEQFSDGHCKTVASGNGGFKHVAIANGVKTNITLTNEVTPGVEPVKKLKATVAGAALVLQATTVRGTGTMENNISGSEMFASGSGFIKYTGVTVPSPAHCSVVGLPGGAGVVETKEARITTLGQAAGRLKIEPITGPTGTFAEFEIVNSGGTCSIANNYKVVGSLTGKTGATFGLGATGKFEHADVTTQGTLHLQSAAGPKVGVEGEVVIKGENGNPLALT